MLHTLQFVAEVVANIVQTCCQFVSSLNRFRTRNLAVCLLIIDSFSPIRLLLKQLMLEFTYTLLAPFGLAIKN